MAAISGAAGLRPTLAAVERGATVALANKECLVCAGALFMRRAAAAGATVLPVDSEHNAMFQALDRRPARGRAAASSSPPRAVRSAPGRAEAMRAATPEQALKHPNWSMGAEDHHRFRDADEQRPGTDRGASSVRARARRDRCAGASAIDRPRPGRIPRRLGDRAARRRPTCASRSRIAWPGRTRIDGPAPRLDLAKIAQLDLRGARPGSLSRRLALARRALETGGAAPTVLNAANEVAVRASSARRLGFAGISALVEATLDAAERARHHGGTASVDEALAVDHMARSLAQTRFCPKLPQRHPRENSNAGS